MIEFQYFDGCPNAVETLNNLKALVDNNILTYDKIKIVEIKNVEDAERLNFQGSPTILMDGIDIYTEAKPVSFAYTCRVYIVDNVRTGVLSKKFISEKIEKLKTNIK